MKNIAKRRMFLAEISLLFVAFIWGGGFVAAEIALGDVSPFYLLAFRFLPSGLVLGVVSMSLIRRLTRKDIGFGVLLGVVLFAGQSFQTIGLNYTTSGKQAFIVAAYTVFVPFASWSLSKAKPKYSDVISGSFVLMGIGLMTYDGSFTLNLGDGFSLMFALIFAYQIVLVRIFANAMNPLALTALQLTTAGTLSLISALFFEAPIESISPSSMIGVLYLFIVNTMIAFLLQNIAQKYTTDVRAGILISLEAIFGCLLSVLMMGEIFTERMLLGAGIIFFATVFSKLSMKGNFVGDSVLCEQLE